MKTTTVGPFLGINNRLPDFSLNVKDAGDWLRDAVNVDIDNAHRPRSRTGQRLVQALTAPHSKFQTASGAHYLVRSSALYQVTVAPYSETLVKVLNSNAQMSYLEHDGILYFSNGTDSGFFNGEVHPMGISTPPAPFVASIAGTLHKGRYQIGVTYTNSTTGRESGAAGTTLHTLASDGALRVTLPGASYGATHINVYVSELNGSVAYLHSTVAVGTATVDITSLAATTRPMREEYEEPLPAGINLFYHKGRLCCTNGNVLYYCNPFRLGYYSPVGGRIQLEHDIDVALENVGGVYLASGNRTQFYAGDIANPDAITTVLPYGAVPGTAFKHTQKPVAGWFGRKGIVLATQQGEVDPVMAESISLTPPAFGCSVILEGEYSRVVSCGWCVNISNRAVTRYTNSDFTSLCGTFGTKANGLYELSGDDDNGVNIDWSVDLGRQNFGTDVMKALPVAYAEVECVEPVILTVVLPNGDEYDYEARDATANLETQRFDLGKGLRENYYGLKLRNQRGASGILASISFAPVATGRRI